MNTQQSPNQQNVLHGAAPAERADAVFDGNMPKPELDNSQAASAHPATTDLFFYSQPIGRGEFYSADGLGNINHLSTFTALPRSFAQILSGLFLR